jgi:hypothetical protein
MGADVVGEYRAWRVLQHLLNGIKKTGGVPSHRTACASLVRNK